MNERRGARIFGLLGLALCMATANEAAAKLYLTRDEALAQVFGDSARVTTRTAYLTEQQVASIAALAHAPFEARRVTYYEARDRRPIVTGDDPPRQETAATTGTLLGHAYIETHRVRTLSETILVVVGLDGRVVRVEVLAFHEPEDYLAPSRWIADLSGRALSPSMAPARDLPNLAGSTLTARALAAGVRRALAVHQTMHGVVAETSASTVAQ